jgi:FkbM family methyltransferase
MQQVLREFLKRLLPNKLVQTIKEKRKAQRQDRRFAISQGKDVLQKVEALGQSFSIYLNPFLNGGVDEVIYETGTWEPEIIDLIKKYLPLGGTFVDIGANIGFHSLFAASVTGARGRVLSFEPLPRLQQQLERSLKENGFTQVMIEPVALGKASGVATLSLVEENIGASSLQNVAGDRAVGGAVEVPVRTLDSYQDKLDRLDLIKIDIEGSEFEALKGGEAILRMYQPVIILEFSPHVYEKDYAGKSLALYEYLTSLGYTINDIEKQVSDIEGKLRSGQLAPLHTNLLCIPMK